MKLAKPISALLVVTLIAVGVVAGRLTPEVFVRLDGNPPRLSWVAPLMLLAGAVVVGRFAWGTWQSLHRRHERMTADHGIKMLSLAKACAVVGALVAGFYGGYALAFAGDLDSVLGKERFVRALSAAIASLLLLIAALLLERACRLPEDDDDEDGKGHKGKGSPGRPGATPA
ncbi:DUF3180 domain-containing protein [Aeromicrobium wangtongii]|uniref:DUF3180 domain-containing protein n=1 Tax=Aeromicrobium wangtongii TaxID=2969247 RepID=UPI002017F632|nr:DUF3180 domain-containing protein [Aeromicrobium wangtongii]MCL3820289.1 DUF3180 domain-containing protein [Aeromicrobium wangtongii]